MPSPACWPRTITAPSSSGSRPTISRYRAGRLTVHLAREFGFCYGVDRAVDYAYQTRERFPDRARVPDRRNHPQPARQREAAGDGHPVPRATSRTRIDRLGARRRRDPAGVRRDRRDAAAARTARLHADRHDLRLGAERLEERPPLRRGRLHVDHPRQGVARGDAGDRVAGGRVRRPVSGRLRSTPKPQIVCDYIRARRRPRRVPRSGSRAPRRRASIPTATCSASASPTRRRC